MRGRPKAQKLTFETSDCSTALRFEDLEDRERWWRWWHDVGAELYWQYCRDGRGGEE